MRTALVTASYAPDFDRCKLLCETIDRFVTGFTKHYIMVEHRDAALFQQLEGPRRVVIDERDLLAPLDQAIPGPQQYWPAPDLAVALHHAFAWLARAAIQAHCDCSTRG